MSRGREGSLSREPDAAAHRGTRACAFPAIRRDGRAFSAARRARQARLGEDERASARSAGAQTKRPPAVADGRNMSILAFPKARCFFASQPKTVTSRSAARRSRAVRPPTRAASGHLKRDDFSSNPHPHCSNIIIELLRCPSCGERTELAVMAK